MDFYFETAVQIMISSLALVAFLWARHFRMLRFHKLSFKT